MNNIKIKDIETERLMIKVPTMNEKKIIMEYSKR